MGKIVQEFTFKIMNNKKGRKLSELFKDSNFCDSLGVFVRSIEVGDRHNITTADFSIEHTPVGEKNNDERITDFTIRIMVDEDTI